MASDQERVLIQNIQRKAEADLSIALNDLYTEQRDLLSKWELIARQFEISHTLFQEKIGDHLQKFYQAADGCHTRGASILCQFV